MNTSIDHQVIPLPSVQPEIDLDEVLKKSKKEALSDKKYIQEVERISNFLNNIKSSKPSDVDYIDKMQGQNNPFLDSLFENSQILEDNMCQYPECFSGVSGELLQSIRIIDSAVNVPDSEGHAHVLKRGDLIIRYDSGKGNKGYVVKSGMRSSRYKEKYLSSSSELNYQVVGPDNRSLNTDWLFLCDNLISSIAIHDATGVMTVAIPVFDKLLIDEIQKEYSNKKLMWFSDSNHQIDKSNQEVSIALPVGRKGQSWAECRDILNTEHNLKQSIIEFKSMLRTSMKHALH